MDIIRIIPSIIIIKAEIEIEKEIILEKEIDMEIDLNMINPEEANQDPDQETEKIKECKNVEDVLIPDPVQDKLIFNKSYYSIKIFPF